MQRQMMLTEVPKPVKVAKTARFDGKTYEHKLDGPRLTKQLERVREYMLAIFPAWKSLAEICSELEKLYKVPFSSNSVSARLCDLRKEKFGGYIVESKRRKGGTWEYLVYQED